MKLIFLESYILFSNMIKPKNHFSITVFMLTQILSFEHCYLVKSEKAFFKFNRHQFQFDGFRPVNPYLQIMENSPRNFSEIFIFRVVTQTVLLENSSNFFRTFNSGASHRPFCWKTHPFDFFARNHLLIQVTFGLDGFSSKTV